MPPVILLRAFDAAGRCCSFKQAAASLHVTPSTISHQIADLERYLGVQLFQRLPRELRLTAAGSALLEDVAVAFTRLREATARLRQHGQPAAIRISANPFLAAEILVPLVQRFEAAFPALSIHVSATESLEDPRDGGVDFCIRFGDGSWSGVESQRLCAVSAVPVIATGLDAATAARIDYPFRGLSVWAGWKARGGPELPTGSQMRGFSNFAAAMRAVEQGLGSTLALWPVVRPWIASGRIGRCGNGADLPLGDLYLLSRTLSPAQVVLRSARDWLYRTVLAALVD